MNDLRIATKLRFAFLFAAVSILLVGILGFYGFSELSGFSQQIQSIGGLPAEATSIIAQQGTPGSLGALLLVIAVLLALVVGVGGMAVSSSIAGPLGDAVQSLQEALQGRASRRLRLNRGDEVGQLGNLVDAVADDYQQMVGVLKKLGDGDVSIELKPRNERDEFMLLLKKIVDMVRLLGGEANRMSRSVMDGKLGSHANLAELKGCYREVLQSLNGAVDALILPLNDAATVLTTLSEGDLTTRCKADYRGDLAKIKTALNNALTHLEDGFSQVAVAAEQVASAASEISTGSHTLASGASAQASSLEEISSSLQEMAAMTKQATGNAKEAKSLTDAARTSADRGVESMRRLSAAIDRIKASSDETAKIVKTIDEIAFQTNLLALNAAVEAARAGDAGRGFAVVAEEVRNLAMRSAEAAKTTASLIEESVKNAEGGVDINQEVLSNLEEINQQVRKVSEVMAEMAAASDQQSEGIDQITSAVEQMNMLTQQTAANSEESASAAEELAGQAEEMKKVLSHFKLKLGDGGPRRAALPAGPGAPAPSTLRPINATRALPPRKVAPVRPPVAPAQDPSKLIPLDDDDSHILQQF